MIEITGNLIQLALEGKFDVIAHGCNCFCNMGAGLAPQMAKTFGCNNFNLEKLLYKGDINKLGTIDFQNFDISSGIAIFPKEFKDINLTVINAYTQYFPGKSLPGKNIPLDCTALRLCMMKINHEFKGKHIGLPLIGCGLAGGSWDVVKDIILSELTDCKVTIVHYK